MGELGGGGPQTLWGYQLYAQQRGSVGLAAGVGEDLPQQCVDWLAKIGCPPSMLLRVPNARTPRAWQLLEDDGRRTQVWRTPACPDLYAMLRPDYCSLPAALAGARGFSLGINPDRPSLELMAQLKQAADLAGGLFAAEPFVWASAPLSAPDLSRLVSACHVFSPNELEARSMTGLGEGATPEDLTRRLLDAGAGMVALRCGERGALVADGATGEAWAVPAVQDARVVDPTGCGNAFVGAFVGALLAGQPLLQACLWGCAAGSLMLEAEGVPQHAPRDLHAEAVRRVAALAPRAKPMVLL